MADYDAVFVGSGINCLVAAALLARDGWRCAVFERQQHLGGAIHTVELVPGYIHDLYAVSHAMFLASEAYAELQHELAARGVAYAHGDVPAGCITDTGASALLTTDLEANAAEFEALARGDGRTWRRICADHAHVAELVRTLLTRDLVSADGLMLAARAHRRLGRHGLLQLAGEMLETCRDWTARFESPAVRALLAPWTLHTGLGPEQASSGFMTRVMALSLQARGTPLPIGGGHRLVDALAGIVIDAGGICAPGSGVRAIVSRKGRAVAVVLDDGTEVGAERAVVAGVSPTQLYGSLLAGIPEAEQAGIVASRFRYGRARMQIHYALREPPQWPDERLLRAATIHVTSGVDAISRAVNEAERRLLPAEPTLTVSQPVAIDPSRGPDRGWIMSIQLHETPWQPRGDAGETIPVEGGTWTPQLRERYADRAQALLARRAPNLERALVKRVALSPRDLAAANENFVNGDGASGAFTLDQSLVWRPRPGLTGHATPIRSLYHVGASTHPGPGLGAGSGIIVARRLRRNSRRSLLSRRRY